MNVRNRKLKGHAASVRLSFDINGWRLKVDLIYARELRAPLRCDTSTPTDRRQGSVTTPRRCSKNCGFALLLRLVWSYLYKSDTSSVCAGSSWGSKLCLLLTDVLIRQHEQAKSCLSGVPGEVSGIFFTAVSGVSLWMNTGSLETHFDSDQANSSLSAYFCILWIISVETNTFWWLKMNRLHLSQPLPVGGGVLTSELQVCCCVGDKPAPAAPVWVTKQRPLMDNLQHNTKW